MLSSFLPYSHPVTIYSLVSLEYAQMEHNRGFIYEVLGSGEGIDIISIYTRRCGLSCSHDCDQHRTTRDLYVVHIVSFLLLCTLFPCFQ